MGCSRCKATPHDCPLHQNNPVEVLPGATTALHSRVKELEAELAKLPALTARAAVAHLEAFARFTAAEFQVIEKDKEIERLKQSHAKRLEEYATENAKLRNRISGEHLSYLKKKEYEATIEAEWRRAERAEEALREACAGAHVRKITMGHGDFMDECSACKANDREHNPIAHKTWCPLSTAKHPITCMSCVKQPCVCPTRFGK